MDWFKKRDKSLVEQFWDPGGIDPAVLADRRLHPAIDLTTLAKALGGRVRPCQLLSRNVGEVEYQELIAKWHGFRVRVGTSDTRVDCSLGPFPTPIGFSVNQPNMVQGRQESLDRPMPHLSLPVFWSRVWRSADIAAWLQAEGNAGLIAALHLSADEALHVWGDVSLVGRPERASVQTIEQLCDLAEAVRSDTNPNLVDGLTFDREKVPADLRPLESLVRRFAVGDDNLRAELLAEATPDERAQLSHRVTPLLSRIDAFLDTFGEPLSDEAILLGRLAEAACEINCSDA
jgi:hypothetical protein